MMKDVYGSSLKYPLLLAYFNENGIFYAVYQKITKFYGKKDAQGVEMFHEVRRMDGQTKRKKGRQAGRQSDGQI